jgi:hypothetical protein
MGDAINKFLAGDYFQENSEEKKKLNQFNKKFFNVDEMEDLVESNWYYIGKLENLEVLDSAIWTSRMQNICDSLPDRVERANEAERLAKENESREEQKIEQIVEEAGLELLYIDGINPGEWEGRIVYEWHITTATGDHYVVFLDDKALLIDGKNHRLLYEMPV